jgi:hypothetical protein
MRRKASKPSRSFKALPQQSLLTQEQLRPLSPKSHLKRYLPRQHLLINRFPFLKTQDLLLKHLLSPWLPLLLSKHPLPWHQHQLLLLLP